MPRPLSGFLLLCALLYTPPAVAAEEIFALFDKLVAQPAITLVFEQNTYNSKNQLTNTARGTLWYENPDRFRLQYDSPNHPLIISDGETMWIYEEELQQVIEQSFAGAQKNGLLKILSSANTAELKKDYVISAGIGADMRWLNANAKDTGTTLHLIALGFDAQNGDLKKIALTDHFGGEIKIDIRQKTDAVENPRSVFSFSPPAGTAVIRQ